VPMLSNVSQFSPQGLLPQFGFPLSIYGSQGQPGFGANSQFGQFGHDFGQGIPGQQQWQTPFTPFAQAPFTSHAGLHSQQQPQHIIPVLVQLAQQLAVQNAVTQQLGAALVQITQHLSMQAVQSPYGQAQSPYGQGFGQGFGSQFGQFGLPPQAQVWGAGR